MKDLETLLATKARLDVLGPTDHGIFRSIYFFDPNGHRDELAADPAGPAEMARLREVAPAMLEAWARTKGVVRHAARIHAKEFSKA